MAKFEKGNKFWELRKNPTGKKAFDTPEDLWKAACEYFEWADNQFVYKSEAKIVNIGNHMSEVQVVQVPTKIPFTETGLCVYLGVSHSYFRRFKNRGGNEDFQEVICQIQDVIYKQKFEGAAAGIYNANLVARALGIKEPVDITSEGKKIDPSAAYMAWVHEQTKDVVK